MANDIKQTEVLTDTVEKVDTPGVDKSVEPKEVSPKTAQEWKTLKGKHKTEVDALKKQNDFLKGEISSIKDMLEKSLPKQDAKSTEDTIKEVAPDIDIDSLIKKHIDNKYSGITDKVSKLEEAKKEELLAQEQHSVLQRAGISRTQMLEFMEDNPSLEGANIHQLVFEYQQNNNKKTNTNTNEVRVGSTNNDIVGAEMTTAQKKEAQDKRVKAAVEALRSSI